MATEMFWPYTQGGSVDEPLAELRGSTTSYYQQDALGSVSSLSNSTAALANDWGMANWRPYRRDCHNLTDQCLRESGLAGGPFLSSP